MNYWVLFSTNYDDGAFLSEEPENGPDDFEYDEGVSLLADYPPQEDAIMKFDSNYPDGIKLYDFVESMNSFHVVNSKVKQLFQNLNIENLEFLPIHLWDHQNKIASDDYFILNPLGSVDFIDMDKSEYDIDDLDKTQICHIDKLIINDLKVPEDAKLFRATTMMGQLFINDEVKDALENANITGYKLMPADGWEGFDF